ncbi:MAG: hypothetical protein KDA45_15490, partial [Planctomycetales bacterium]|nr:hypothetical protein [Planctomycetales bacterium]
EIYLVLLALSTLVALAISLVLRAAAAAIDFPSENHSTPVRRRMLALFSLSLFWTLFAVVSTSTEEIARVFLLGAFIVCLGLGALLTGERGMISPRAQRTLPHTFLGRVFLTWLYPGAGLGYVFMVCMYAALVGTLVFLDIYFGSRLQRMWGDSSMVATGYLLLCYLAIYLGANRLLLLLLPRHLPGRMVTSVALLTVLLVMSHLLPLFAVYFANDYRDFDYGWHQALNIPWSTQEVLDSGSLDSLSWDIGATMVIVTLCATAIFGLNLVLCTRDVMLVRVALPPRIRQEIGLAQPIKPQPADPFASD